MSLFIRRIQPSDNAERGINVRLAERLSRAMSCRCAAAKTDRCKVVVFVPTQDLNAVADALFAAGAGQIGHYRECSFRQEGLGTFFGTEATNPTIGQKGRREEVREFRLEAVCPKDCVDAIVACHAKGPFL